MWSVGGHLVGLHKDGECPEDMGEALTVSAMTSIPGVWPTLKTEDIWEISLGFYAKSQ